MGIRSANAHSVIFAAVGVWVSIGLPSLASAGNGLHPRTPVEFPNAPCMTVVDRSVDPVMHLDYAIPYEDTEVTEDEVHNSRTHQFFAFCRDYHVNKIPPTWVTWTDVMEAEVVGLVPPELTDEDVFETSAEWADCWFRLNEDADRRPITYEEAMMGVDWDTTGLPAGPYVLRGYTYEPAFNIWWRRTGVVHVVDGPELAGLTPAIALEPVTDGLTLDDTVDVQGCVRAAEGSVVDAYWALADSDEIVWEPFAMDVPVTGETFSIGYMPTPETLNHSLIFRVDVRDLDGRRFEAHVPTTSFVIEDSGCDDGSGTNGGIVVPPGCETTTTDTTGDPTESPTTDSPTSGETATSTGTPTGPSTGATDSETTGNETGEGCACRTGSPAWPGSFVFTVVIWHTCRRRRRSV